MLQSCGRITGRHPLVIKRGRVCLRRIAPMKLPAAVEQVCLTHVVSRPLCSYLYADLCKGSAFGAGNPLSLPWVLVQIGAAGVFDAQQRQALFVGPGQRLPGEGLLGLVALQPPVAVIQVDAPALAVPRVAPAGVPDGAVDEDRIARRGMDGDFFRVRLPGLLPGRRWETRSPAGCGE